MSLKTRFPTLLLIASAAVLASILPAAGSDDEATRGELLTEGASSYNLYCQSCHGPRGQGDGSVAELLKIAPADLTTISARRDGEFPEEEIYSIVDGRKDVRAHGSDMPLWGDAFQRTEETEDEAVIRRKIDGLVVYLKSLQEPAAAAE